MDTSLRERLLLLEESRALLVDAAEKVKAAMPEPQASGFQYVIIGLMLRLDGFADMLTGEEEGD